MKRNPKPVELLHVALDFGDRAPLSVGRLVPDNGRIYFEYDPEFLDGGLQISPYKLPLKTGTFSFEPSLFEGLSGVFNDSLPDGWGRLLLDRLLRSNGVLPETFSPLDRLAHVGKTGMGALTYLPDYGGSSSVGDLDLDELNEQTKAVLRGESSDVLENLIQLNGSSAGARPKALIGFNPGENSIIQAGEVLPSGYTPWIVKFGNSRDGADAGAIEYVYNLMALKAGLELPDFHLFKSKGNAGYFAAKRFDRLPEGKKLHVHTACGLLHSDFRIPALDYEDLIRATLWLTKDVRQAQKIYRYAVFNVLAHNRDDHSKNFSFLMDKKGVWRVSPAYDLTFSSGPAGQQSMLVAGEGQQPGKADLLKLAPHADLSRNEAIRILEEVQAALGEWKNLATNYGVTNDNIQLISKRIN
ncbi:type II toxin-antitoxin system HipA family toxin [Persicitalea jodogahamensis]|uniref:Toxin HipA n=1 Tax=Persicitalea jodogahamensis TaxID=402147 RepID=A0A8J3D6T8_9BACT|nr:type II toxin-antitoxin system HipA family toxin [Persicitalea jodogahamensis]GHB82811.1 toxin HipA [Persicitalea jodogahamensis]